MHRSRLGILGLGLALFGAAFQLGCGASRSSSSQKTTQQAALSSIAVTPANPTIVTGTSISFTATGTFTDGSQKDVTAQAMWASGTPAVATIGNTGDPQPVNAAATGSSVITASIGAISGSTTLTVTSATVSVSVTPKHAELAASAQTQQFSANVAGDPNHLGATWTVDGIPGGSAASGTITAAGLYTPPAAGGTHTIVATSVLDSSKSASALVAITDLAGVFTYHNDLARDGVNSHEFALTTSKVNQNAFGKLFSCPVDGAVYAQPLWVPGVSVSGGTHNVVFVATQHDSLYAFDSDTNPCHQLWKVSLIDSTHGGTSGETSVLWSDVGNGDKDIFPEVGVTGTPVIDPATNTLYIVSKSETAGPIFHQRLHAIDLATGAERFSGPVDISASAAGKGDGAVGGTVTFNLQSQNQRPALALLNGVVYISWSAHEDKFPYHGWLIGYSANDVQQRVSVFNTTPNASPSEGGIWMSGGGPAADSSGNLYFTTGNGTFNANQTTAPNTEYGDTALKMTTAGGLTVADYFTPDDQATLLAGDQDLSSGGVVLLPDQSGPVQHLLVAGGKEGVLYLIDRDNMGHFQSTSNDQIVQTFSAVHGLFSTPVFWQNQLYVGISDAVKVYKFNTISGMFATTPASQSTTGFGFPAPTPALSAQGSSNGIIWAMDNHCYGVPSACGTTATATILHAYDASNLATELWNSSQAANNRDQAGAAVKFTTPTVANGKVYIGTRTELDVYGLLP